MRSGKWNDAEGGKFSELYMIQTRARQRALAVPEVQLIFRHIDQRKIQVVGQFDQSWVRLGITSQQRATRAYPSSSPDNTQRGQRARSSTQEGHKQLQALEVILRRLG